MRQQHPLNATTQQPTGSHTTPAPCCIPGTSPGPAEAPPARPPACFGAALPTPRADSTAGRQRRLPLPLRWGRPGTRPAATPPSSKGSARRDRAPQSIWKLQVRESRLSRHCCLSQYGKCSCATFFQMASKLEEVGQRSDCMGGPRPLRGGSQDTLPLFECLLPPPAITSTPNEWAPAIRTQCAPCSHDSAAQPYAPLGQCTRSALALLAQPLEHDRGRRQGKNITATTLPSIPPHQPCQHPPWRREGPAAPASGYCRA